MDFKFEVVVRHARRLAVCDREGRVEADATNVVCQSVERPRESSKRQETLKLQTPTSWATNYIGSRK